MNIDEMLRELKNTEHEMVEKHYNATLAMHEAEKVRRNAGKEVQFLRRLIWMAGWNGNRKPMEWCLICTHRDVDKCNWKEFWEFVSAKLEFKVIIKERSDLKKYMYQVEISGTLGDISPSSHQNSAYIDYEYIKRKYDGKKLEEKFTTEDAAREFATLWMDKMVADHWGTLVEEDTLLRQIREEGVKL